MFKGGYTVTIEYDYPENSDKTKEDTTKGLIASETKKASM
jgi:hypothetical protein